MYAERMKAICRFVFPLWVSFRLTKPLCSDFLCRCFARFSFVVKAWFWSTSWDVLRLVLSYWCIDCLLPRRNDWKVWSLLLDIHFGILSIIQRQQLVTVYEVNNEGNVKQVKGGEGGPEAANPEYEQANHSFWSIAADTYGKPLDKFVRFLWMLANSAPTKFLVSLSHHPGTLPGDPSPDSCCFLFLFVFTYAVCPSVHIPMCLPCILCSYICTALFLFLRSFFWYSLFTGHRLHFFRNYSSLCAKCGSSFSRRIGIRIFRYRESCGGALHTWQSGRETPSPFFWFEKADDLQTFHYLRPPSDHKPC